MYDYKGIDVSSFDGEIDWAKVKDDGIRFAIIRVSAGSELDTRFGYNISEATKRDIKCGVYLYTYARDTATARAEAELALREVKPYKVDLPIFYDIEDIAQHNLTKTERTDLIDAFCSRIEQDGYKAGVYSSLDWFLNYFETDRIEQYYKWIADWDVAKPDYSGRYEFWQYSDTGRVNGIDDDVDLDRWYTDEELEECEN